MKNYKKTIKLISELTGFYFDIGAKDLHIDIIRDDKEVIIYTAGHVVTATQEKIDEARRVLNSPREPQVEEYYWELMGETVHGEELSLLGMMIDKAEVNYKDDFLEIKIFRKL